jgi:hypothetical protein
MGTPLASDSGGDTPYEPLALPLGQMGGDDIPTQSHQKLD